jgi:hypothetical protein
MKPTQIYETTIFDRESGAGLGFVTVPLRVFPYQDPEGAYERLATALDFQPVEVRDPRGRLPEAIDQMLAYPTEYRAEWIAPSEFATYLASDARIPVEQSPMQGRTLADIVGGGGVFYGTVQGDPLAFVLGLGAIVLFGPAQVVGEWGTAKMRELLNVPGPE